MLVKSVVVWKQKEGKLIMLRRGANNHCDTCNKTVEVCIKGAHACEKRHKAYVCIFM
jgi:hypothetical protein